MAGWLRAILQQASDEVESWPEWKRSASFSKEKDKLMDDYQRKTALAALTDLLQKLPATDAGYHFAASLSNKSIAETVREFMLESYQRGVKDISRSSSIEAFTDAALLAEVRRRGLATVSQVLLQTIKVKE